MARGVIGNVWQTLTANAIGFDMCRRLCRGAVFAVPEIKSAHSVCLILAIVTLSSKAAKRMTPLINSFR